jgi:hypothetical protein
VKKKMEESRIVLLNALPLNAFLYSSFNISVRKLDNLKELKKRIERISEGGNKSVVSYIRHPATVQLLQKNGIKAETISMLYQYFPGDRIFVITLGLFQQRGQEKTELEESDVLIYEVDIYGAR